MFTAIATGKYNFRMLSKISKSPQLRGHPYFCLWTAGAFSTHDPIYENKQPTEIL